MRLRALGIALLLLSPAACAGRDMPRVEAPTIRVPERITDEEAFVDALNELALSAPGSSERAQLRELLLAHVVELGRADLEAKDWEALTTDLEHAVSLWRPAELRELAPKSEELAQLGRALYRASARMGLERESVFALSVLRQFGGPDDAAHVEGEWAALVGWVERGRAFSRDPSVSTDLEQVLEEVSAVFPSPWLVDTLTALYISRSLAARKGTLSPQASSRTEFAAYLLVRLHLRADDPLGAIRAIDQLPPSEASEGLRELLSAVANGAETSLPYDDLIGYFQPEPAEESELPEYVITQGWGIVENVALRALRLHPDDALARLALGRAYYRYGLHRAALFHLRQVIDEREPMFEAWEEMAFLEQRELERLAGSNPDAALETLPEVERLHERARKLWRDRPIDPGLPIAYVTVAQGLFSAGKIDAAMELLERSITLEPIPEALDLRGTIHARTGRADEALASYEALLALPFEDAGSRRYWELVAREQLGEISIRAGRVEVGRDHLEAALAELNSLLGRGSALPVEARSLWLIDRGRVFFHLNELDLARDDFEAGAALAPGSPGPCAEPLLLAVTYGHHEMAAEVFDRCLADRAMDQDLMLYFALWLADLGARQGKAPHEAAVALISTYEGEAWHVALARHARGELSYEMLLEEAENRGHQAEAHFYEGLRRWREGDQSGSKALLEKVIATQMVSFFEFQMARAYLDWGGPPAAPRRVSP